MTFKGRPFMPPSLLIFSSIISTVSRSGCAMAENIPLKELMKPSFIGSKAFGGAVGLAAGGLVGSAALVGAPAGSGALVGAAAGALVGAGVGAVAGAQATMAKRISTVTTAIEMKRP